LAAMFFKTEISRRVAQVQYLALGRPDHIIFFGQGIGDDLLCTAVAHELKKRGAGRIVMFSKYPGLFKASPDVSAVYDLGYPTVGRLRRWGISCIVPQFSSYDEAHDRDVFRNEPIIAAMCRIAGMTGSVELRPYLTLRDGEKKAGRLYENQVVIQSSGLASGSGVMKNKNWFPERYQAVSDEIGASVKVIQLGQKTDPPVDGAHDLRGKTTLRESAAILASSRVFIGQVGFLMHLARAVDCRGVIVYGGREVPWISGYRANENIVGPTFCSPCWQRNKCDYGHECMRMIDAGQVVAAFRRQLERADTPLEVDQVSLT
jgi:hypothetical protein